MKARFFALAALVLGLASCQQEFNGAAPVGGEVDFQLSVDAVELATRAGENGAADAQNAWDSAFGAIDYLQALKADQADAFRVDWTEVDLRYSLEVYDAVDSYVDAAPVKDRQVVIVDSYEKATFDLRLVPNRNYRFVVFADFVPQGANNNPAIEVQRNLGLHHTIGSDLRDIKVRNDKDAKDAINDETTDAYFASEVITISNSAAKDIVLKRPYGKVRVIATDLAELNLNVDPAYVEVNYTAKHPQTFNAVTGTIGSYEENVSYEFLSKYAENVGKVSLDDHYYTVGCDAITAKNNNNVERHTHMTLFTDYILATDDQQTIQFTMAVYDKKNGLIKETNFNTEIPVQRNNLTTVIGNVLTTATEINVTINDNFANEIEKPVVFVNTAKELQEALDAYVDGQTILFDADIKGNVTIDQAGKNYVICGNNYKFDGTITIDGNSNITDAETVRIEKVNFESADAIYFIEMNSTASADRYAHNVTIENCTFKGGEKAVGMRFRQCYNIVVKNCEVISGHSLAQLYGCTGVTIENTKVNADRGVSFGTSLNCVVKNSEFNVESYGLRYDGSVATTYNVENVKINAYFPVIVREAKADFALNFVGENKLTAPGYQVILTSGSDDAPFVAPTSDNYTLTGADEFIVFPSDKLYVYEKEQLQEFINNAKDGDIIYFADDIEGDVTVAQKPDVKFSIDGRGYNYAGVITVDGKSATYTTAGLIISNIKFNAEAISADACIRLGGSNATRYTCNVHVKGCTFDVPGAVGVKSYTGGDKNLTISNCTATAKAHSLLQAKGIDGILVEGCTVNSKNGLNFNNSNNVVVESSKVEVKGYAVRFGEGSAATGGAETYTIKKSSLTSECEDGDAVIVLRGTADKATLIIEETTINGKPQIINNAVEAKVYVDGAIVASSADEIAAALTADKANVSVVLAKDIDLPISKLGQQTGGSGEYKLGGEQTENITIDLNGYKLNITTTYWSAIGAKNDNARFTIKNGTMTSSQPTGTWNSYDLTFSNCNYVIKDVVFEKAIAFAATGKSASLKDVTIKETHDYYAMWICAEGLNVTADNLTIASAGRGIKIDEQYIDAPAKVILTVKNSKFTTAKKAAIMVKSAAGAEINVENLDITGVDADKVNAVWVDADSAAYFDLVTVNGAYKAQEL